MSGQPPFAETSYGVVKRLEVVKAWVADASRRLGKSRLTILDYGCGTGDQLTAPLAAAGHDVLGLDMHEPTVVEARRRHQHISSLTFASRDIVDLLDDRTRFDVVICSEVLEHIDDPAEFLGQLRALTRANGVLIVTTPNGWGSFELLTSAERWFKAAGVHQVLRSLVWTARRVSAGLRGAPIPARPLEHLTSVSQVGFLNYASGHVQFFRLNRLQQLFTDAGFAIVDRRARTLLCGPYVDAMFGLSPWRSVMFRWNNRAADVLPFSLAADWMFLLRRPQ
jgi:2-polyprenyl-3-methyl-5-hydroxy-6-metoxy-1,4-benzoquinol methylase